MWVPLDKNITGSSDCSAITQMVKCRNVFVSTLAHRRAGLGCVEGETTPCFKRVMRYQQEPFLRPSCRVHAWNGSHRLSKTAISDEPGPAGERLSNLLADHNLTAHFLVYRLLCSETVEESISRFCLDWYFPNLNVKKCMFSLHLCLQAVSGVACAVSVKDAQLD